MHQTHKTNPYMVVGSQEQDKIDWSYQKLQTASRRIQFKLRSVYKIKDFELEMIIYGPVSLNKHKHWQQAIDTNFSIISR